jgi:hypothetical protein
VPDPIEPVVHRVIDTADNPAEPDLPYSHRPDLLAREVAARAVAPALVGMTVAAARAHVDQQAQRRAVHIYVEFRTGRGPAPGVRKYGRICAEVRDGVVVSASG